MKAEDQCDFRLLKKMKMALSSEDTDGSVCQFLSTKAQCASSSLPRLSVPGHLYQKGGGWSRMPFFSSMLAELLSLPQGPIIYVLLMK